MSSDNIPSQMCRVCKQEYSATLEFFYRNTSYKNDLDSRCKKCVCDKTRLWQLNNSDKYRAIRKRYQSKTPFNETVRRNYRYQAQYGLDLTAYNAILEQQKGCCAICQRHQSVFKYRLSVDHCHQTKTVRGLLCNECNLGLGKFRDQAHLLHRAAAYVDSHQIQPGGSTDESRSTCTASTNQEEKTESA